MPLCTKRGLLAFRVLRALLRICEAGALTSCGAKRGVSRTHPDALRKSCAQRGSDKAPGWAAWRRAAQQDNSQGRPRAHRAVRLSCSPRKGFASACPTWSINTLCLSPTGLHTESTVMNSTGWITRKWLIALRYILKWILSETQNLKGAQNRRMRGKLFYAKRRCSTGSQELRKKSKKQVGFLHCSSNITTSMKCFNFSCCIDILICDVINGCCRNTNSCLKWKNRQNFKFSANHKKASLP